MVELVVVGIDLYGLVGDAGRMNADLELLFDFLRFASVSTDTNHAQDCRRCAQWLVDFLRDMDFEVELIETEKHPVVYASSPVQPDVPTLLVYGHYDVQPVDPLELWDSQPFEPVLKDGRIIARGATDNKGQILAHILGAKKMMEQDGKLPINLKFLIEGEEEIGSVNLPKLLQDRKEQFACDVMCVSDSGMLELGQPTFGYGLRGISCLEFRVKGPNSDLHSGIYGGSVLNPATVVANLVASLHDEDWRVAIEGFYDGVVEPQDWEKEAWARMDDADAEVKRNTGAAAAGEAGFDSRERVWVRPTAEVNGIFGGYQGEGSKTVLPSWAGAKLSCRLVPGQDRERILRLAEAHLRKHCPEGVELEVELGHTGPPYYTDPHSCWGKAAQRALRETFPGKEVAFVREGGSIPIIPEMGEILDGQVLLLGLCLPDAKIHAPNENFPVENFEAGIRLHQHLLRSLAEVE